jgi:hypothetical protein
LCDIALCCPYVNRCFGGWKSADQDTWMQQVARLHTGCLLGWFSTLKMVIHYSETSMRVRTTWHYIPEDSNIHNYCCENLKSCGIDPLFYQHLLTFMQFAWRSLKNCSLWEQVLVFIMYLLALSWISQLRGGTGWKYGF